jgi:hypothetical protein
MIVSKISSFPSESPANRETFEFFLLPSRMSRVRRLIELPGRLVLTKTTGQVSQNVAIRCMLILRDLITIQNVD